MKDNKDIIIKLRNKTNHGLFTYVTDKLDSNLMTPLIGHSMDYSCNKAEVKDSN